MIFAVALPYAVYRGKKDWSWKVPLAISLSVNFIYIGFNFLPYMLMAFINDPLQTFFIYILILFVGACAFMFILRSVKAIAKCCCNRNEAKCCCNRNEGNSCHDCCHTFCFLFLAISLVISVILSIIAIAYILTLGSFHDFQGLKSVLLPIMVTLLVMVLLKPGYKRVMGIFSTGESNDPADPAAATAAEETGRFPTRTTMFVPSRTSVENDLTSAPRLDRRTDYLVNSSENFPTDAQ